MFRKPKRPLKKTARRKKPRDDAEQEENTDGVTRSKDTSDDDDDDDNNERTSTVLYEARKRAKSSGLSLNKKSNDVSSNNNKEEQEGFLLHPKQVAPTEALSQKEKATATNQYHPVDLGKPDPNRNKFLAQPIRAPTNVRVTCRFDYQPDICKDYKDTGFCGFGDTCIYLHDRGDTMTGWQLDQKWEQEQAKKKQEKDRQIEAFLGEGEGDANGGEDAGAVANDEDLPFACFLCRQAFEDPIVTPCGHYFCQKCLHQHNQENDDKCPICKKDTHGVMNQPIKLNKQKRKLLGQNSTWQEFMDNAKNKKRRE
jgi:RING finger protein 113A